jgi:NAD(P)-dependent dehydrogenase (short-subunit alcohol dehydrogenase family)
MNTTTTLEGQTILIIGGTSGIGFGVAIASLNNGAAKVIVAFSTSDKVNQAVERLKEQSSKTQATIEGIVIDGNDLAGIAKVVKSVGVINHLASTGGNLVKGFGGTNFNDINFEELHGELMDIFN